MDSLCRKNVKGHEFILQSSIIQLRIISQPQDTNVSAIRPFIISCDACCVYLSPLFFFGFAVFQIAVIYPFFCSPL